MREKILAFALVVALRGTVGGALSDEAGIETRSFAVKSGDTLVITNDSGKIRIQPSGDATLELKIQKSPAQKESPEVTARRSGDNIFIASAFSGAPGASADFEIKAPDFLNVTISGAGPEVNIAGFRGRVRIQDSTGRITAENLTSAASLTTDSGDIVYRTNVQPQGDVRLESTSGNVQCELASGLNLHSWIRAGGKIFWDMDPMVQATSVEKQLGTLGPLLYAGSLKGDVIVRLKPGAEAISLVASGGIVPRAEGTQRNPESLPSTSDPPPYQATVSAPSTPSKAPVPAPPSRGVYQSPEPTASQSADTRPTASASTASGVQRVPSTKEDQQPAVIQGGYALKVDVDSVFLNVSVRERTNNRSMAGLRKGDFLVYEDGVQQQIDQFLPTEAPFNLLLLLDVSGSTQSYLHLMKEAATDFIRQINADDRVAIATFNSNVQLVENFTNDRAVAEKAIQRIKSGGGTAFYDALMTCLDRYMRGIEGRSAIVVFTDGVDNQLEGKYSAGSRTTFDDLLRRVQETDTIIYTIFLNTEGQVPAMTRRPSRYPGGGWPGGRRGGRFPGSPFPFPFPTPSPSPYPSPNPNPNPYPRGREDQKQVYETARDQLQEIADQTGGRMYTPRKIDELSGVYTQIADDLRIQYQLGYNSTDHAHDGKWRALRVEVRDHPDAVVRTRKGYYARKDNTQ